MSIHHTIKSLKPLVEFLIETKDLGKRLNFLNKSDHVVDFLKKHPNFNRLIKKYSKQEQYIIKSLLVLGQGSIIFQNILKKKRLEIHVNELVKNLMPVEHFYRDIGGIIGYHISILQLLVDKEIKSSLDCNPPNYLKPVGYDLEKETDFVRKTIRATLESLSSLAEIYPVGGAGDRLMLKHEQTMEDLPAAELKYLGRTLLESLIRDLQAREYLAYKLFEKQVTIPVAMMTSDEKNNHEHILSICKRLHWFSRPRKAFYFFKQPLVPVLTEEGDWAVSEPMKLILKPGGHGVIWKLASDSGVIDKLIKQGCKKALVRQINNPIAATDYGLMAFSGVGILEDQNFGFASCPRRLNTAEGVNILEETKSSKGYGYCISNIEYPDFVKKNIQDIPEKPGSSCSAFPSNTNILFVDLKNIQKIIKKCPLPGKLINMKKKVTCLDQNGKKRDVFAGRLETLMQNIADVIVTYFPRKKKNIKPQDLNTFLTYNERRKTISVTKKLQNEDTSIVETPDGCFYDQLLNHHELLTKFCGVQLPNLCSEQDYIKKGPNFVMEFHPALGPNYSIIAQKIRKGTFKENSELLLEIAELEMKNTHLEGSLLINAENVMGHMNAKGILKYSEKVGRCILRNVNIKNKGIDRSRSNIFWKNEIHRKEALSIKLHGHSEFVAENISFEGNLDIEVPNGYRMIAKESNRGVVFALEKIKTPSWCWKYRFDSKNHIILH